MDEYFEICNFMFHACASAFNRLSHPCYARQRSTCLTASYQMITKKRTAKKGDFIHWKASFMAQPGASGNQLYSNTPTVPELQAPQKTLST